MRQEAGGEMQRGEQHPSQALGDSRMEGSGTVRDYCSHLHLQGLDKMLLGVPASSDILWAPDPGVWEQLEQIGWAQGRGWTGGLGLGRKRGLNGNRGQAQGEVHSRTLGQGSWEKARGVRLPG